MPVTIKEEEEIDKKIHHFIENLVEEYGYLVVKMEWNITVERMRSDISAHRTRYTDSESVSSVNNDADHG